MITNQPIVDPKDPKDPKDPINADKVVDYFKGVLKNAGRNINEQELYKIAGRKDLKSYITTWYIENLLAKQAPNKQQIDSIYNTWIDKTLVEKKNQVQTSLKDFPAKKNVIPTPSEQQFISGNGKSSLDSDSKKVDLKDPIKYDVLKIAPRKGVRKNDDNTESTHLMAYSEADGKFIAYPTLFQNEKGEFYTSKDPFQEAKKRKEVFAFDTEEEAKNFALGSWKKPNLTFNTPATLGNNTIESKYLSGVVDNIPKRIFNLSESEAAFELNKILRNYKIKVNESGFASNKIEVELPDKTKQEFRLFTDSYKAQLGRTQSEEQIKKLEQTRFNELKNFILGKNSFGQTISNPAVVDGLIYEFSVRDNIIPIVQQEVANISTLPEDEIEALSNLSPNIEKSDFYTDGVFDPNKALFILKMVENAIKPPSKDPFALEKGGGLLDANVGFASPFGTKLMSKDEINKHQKINEARKLIDTYIERVKSKKESSSKIIGSALGLSGRYAKLDLFDKEYMKKLIDSGLSIKDIPTDGIKIDGVPSSINTLQEIITDPTGRNEVIFGNIKLEIDENHKAYGVLSPIVEGAAKLIERNEAKDYSKGKIGKAGSALKVGYEFVEDLVQAAGLGSMDIMAHTGVLLSDMFQMAGLDEVTSDNIVFGQYGLPVFFPRPEVVRSLKEEALPLYETDISDAKSFGELLALANQPFAESIPHFLVFSVNPGLGLGVTAANSYGASLTELDALKEAVKQDLESGAILTQSQKNILNMSNWEARGYALSQATSETVLTRLFTYNYFKSLRGARNFKGAKTVDNVRKISKEYSKTHSLGWIKKLARLLGINYKTLLTEIPEETIIAFNSYMIRVHWGLEDWDDEKAKKLLANTAITSAISSTGLAKVSNYARTRKVRKVVDEYIRNNIKLEKEFELIQFRNEADAFNSELRLKSPEESKLIQQSEIVLSKANTRLLDFKKRKDELVSKMTDSDKQTFLELMTKLTENRAKFDGDWFNPKPFGTSDVTNNNTIKQVVEDMKNTQEKLKKILSRYPSELSYYFLDSETKLKYDEKASKSLQEEALEDKTELEITQEQISERAAKMYLQDVNDGIRENQEKFYPAIDYMITDPSRYFVVLPDEDIDGFNLKNTINNFYEMKAPVKKPEPKEGDVILKDDPIAVTVDTKALDYDRASSLVSRIEAFNADADFMKQLPNNQRNHIIKFFKDIENGKDPAFGYVESVLDAYDIAIKIAAKTPGKIDIFQKAGVKITDDMTAMQRYQNINAWVLKNQGVGGGFLKDKGFATGDMMLKILFRDSDVGKPFYDLFREINRKVDSEKSLSNASYNKFLKEYELAVKKFNKQNNTEFDVNPNGKSNSYELYMLAGAFRKSGITIGEQKILSMLDKPTKKIFKEALANIRKGVAVEVYTKRIEDVLEANPEAKKLYEEGSKESFVDVEFARWKNLLKQELLKREEDYNKSETPKEKASNKEKFELWKNTYDRLGFDQANSFDDLKGAAFNLDAVKKLASMQKNDESYQRITDFGGKLSNEDRGTTIPFIDGTYVPVPISKTDMSNVKIANLRKESDAPENADYTLADAAILSNISFLSELGTDFRLNPGIYIKNAFSRMRGSNIDISARKDMTTLMYVLDNPTFKQVFKNENDYELVADYFRSKQDVFNGLVNEGNEISVDIGSESWKKTVNNAIQAFYTAQAAKALARIDQRPAQYYSATSGTFPYLKSKQAKSHLNRQNWKFIIGLSGASNGYKKNTIVGKLLQNLFGFGDLSNIYSKSRTGVRNALKSELLLTDDTAVPLEYYTNYFGVSDSKLIDKMKRMIGLKATIDQFLNFSKWNNEVSLEFWLASSDRAAANAAFEAHYLDHRISQGENMENVDFTNWWKKENENPNIEAINYADAMVAQTMRQTGSLSESGIYTPGHGLGVDTAIRAFIPFQRFLTNAKTNFSTQYAILMDETVPPSQKQEAKKAMQGIMQEVLSFQGVKLMAGLYYIQGFAAGILGIGLEEEDKPRYGGYTQIVGSDFLPIEDRPGVVDDLLGSKKKYEDFVSKSGYGEKQTKEGKSLKAISMEFNENPTIEDAADIIYRYSREYRNKFTVAQEPSVLAPAIQDYFSTIFPVVTPGPASDMIWASVNKLLNEDLFREYVSGDLNSLRTKEGRNAFVVDNLSGLYGIGNESFTKLVDATVLYMEHKYIVSSGEYGEQEFFVGAGESKEAQKELDNAIDLLYYMRLSLDHIPAVPKGDINKFANYLQRAIENEFKTNPPPKEE